MIWLVDGAANDTLPPHRDPRLTELAIYSVSNQREDPKLHALGQWCPAIIRLASTL